MHLKYSQQGQVNDLKMLTYSRKSSKYTPSLENCHSSNHISTAFTMNRTLLQCIETRYLLT